MYEFGLSQRLAVILVGCAYILFITCEATGEGVDTLKDIGQLEIPEPSELTSEYPGEDDNVIAGFQKRIHSDFATLLTVRGDAMNLGLLDGYLGIRDTWLEEDSLSKFILSCSITYAIDRLLIQLALEHKATASEMVVGLSDIAERNSLKPRYLLQRFEVAIGTLPNGGMTFDEMIGENCTVMPGGPCWVSYAEQYGLSYKKISLGEITLVFLDCPLGSFQNVLGRAGILDDIGVNSVFLLHANRPEFYLQFIARVVDAGRTREIIWGSNTSSDDDPSYENRIAEIAGQLAALAPAGKRWLAVESYATSDEKTNVILLIQGLSPGYRELDFATPVTTEAISHYRAIMRSIVGQKR